MKIGINHARNYVDKFKNLSKKDKKVKYRGNAKKWESIWNKFHIIKSVTFLYEIDFTFSQIFDDSKSNLYVI